MCSWGGPEGAFTITVLPVAMVPQDLVDRYATVGCVQNYDWPDCHLSATADGTWALATRAALDADGAAPDLAGISEAALAAAAQWPAPWAPDPTGQWWSGELCDALAEGLDLSDVFGGAEYAAGYPTDIGSHPVEEIVTATSVWCPWYSYDLMSGVWLDLFPGAGAQWDAAVAMYSAEPAVVAGSTAAARGRLDPEAADGGEVLLATDGTNILMLREAPIDHAEFASQALAALAATTLD